MNELPHPPSEDERIASHLDDGIARRLAEAGDPTAAKVVAAAVAAQRRAQPLLAIPPVVLDAEVHERKAFQLLTPEEGWGSPREARVAEAHAHATLALSLRKRDELELAFGFGYDTGRYGS